MTALQIGSFRINNPITLLSEASAGAFADDTLAGNIGAQIANRFRRFLDYGRRRIILEPSSAFGNPYDRAFSRLALRAEGADYRALRVERSEGATGFRRQAVARGRAARCRTPWAERD